MTASVRELSKGLSDKLLQIKGYISKALTDDLKEDGIRLVTTQRPTKEYLSDRTSRHRSLHGFTLNLVLKKTFNGVPEVSPKRKKPR